MMSERKEIKEKILTPHQVFQVQLINEQTRITKLLSSNSVNHFLNMNTIAGFIANLPNNEATGDLKDIFDRCCTTKILDPINKFAVGLGNQPKPKTPTPEYKHILQVWNVVSNYASQRYCADAGYVSPIFGQDTLESLEE